MKKKKRKPKSQVKIRDIQWKKDVRLKWENKCMRCGVDGCKLDTHHLVYYKELKGNPEIGVLLCSGCHKLRNDSAHKGAIIFYDWFRNAHPDIHKRVLELVIELEENKRKGII
jgi:hypothetical protein